MRLYTSEFKGKQQQWQVILQFRIKTIEKENCMNTEISYKSSIIKKKSCQEQNEEEHSYRRQKRRKNGMGTEITHTDYDDGYFLNK